MCVDACEHQRHSCYVFHVCLPSFGAATTSAKLGANKRGVCSHFVSASRDVVTPEQLRERIWREGTFGLYDRELPSERANAFSHSGERHYVGQSIENNFPEDFCWLDGRVIYAVREPAPNSRDSNLWAGTVDAKSGRPRSQPRRITNLAGSHMETLSVTADGKKLVFESSNGQSYVYVGGLDRDGNLENLRRLTRDQRYNTSYTWTSELTLSQEGCPTFAPPRAGPCVCLEFCRFSNRSVLYGSSGPTIGPVKAFCSGLLNRTMNECEPI
jgi:hypothetical protein